MNTAIFCKTCRSDLAWLYFGLSSLRQNWRCPTNRTDIVVVADLDCQIEIDRWGFDNVRVVYTKPWPDGYCHAMAMKLCADLFCPDAQLILLFDSDMMLLKPTAVSDLMEHSKPMLVYDVWHSDIEQPVRESAKKVWVPAVWRSMGRELKVDWMVSPQWLFWSSTFRGARSLIESFRNMPFLQAVYSSQPYDWHRFMDHPMTFCDMQALGIFASDYEQHKYVIRQRSLPADSPIKQFWSHQPIEEVKPFIIESAMPSAPVPQTGLGGISCLTGARLGWDPLKELPTASSELTAAGTPRTSPSPDSRRSLSSRSGSGTGRELRLHSGQSG